MPRFIYRFSVLLIFSVVFSTSCVTNGRPFPSDVSWIKEGVTTQNEVLKILGDPHAVGSSSGNPTWTYGYYKYKLFGKSYIKELKFYWDKSTAVGSFSFNSSFPDDTQKLNSKK